MVPRFRGLLAQTTDHFPERPRKSHPYPMRYASLTDAASNCVQIAGGDIPRVIEHSILPTEGARERAFHCKPSPVRPDGSADIKSLRLKRARHDYQFSRFLLVAIALRGCFELDAF